MFKKKINKIQLLNIVENKQNGMKCLSTKNVVHNVIKWIKQPHAIKPNKLLVPYL